MVTIKTAIANGMVNGPVWGPVITWVGALAGAISAFALVRMFGRPLLVRFLAAHQLQQLGEWSRESGGLALLVARLIPAIAFNLVNYADSAKVQLAIRTQPFFGQA